MSFNLNLVPCASLKNTDLTASKAVLSHFQPLNDLGYAPNDSRGRK